MKKDIENQPINEIDRLRQDIEIIKRKKYFFDNLRKMVPITGIIVFLVLTILYIYFDHKYPLILIIGIFYLVIAIIFPLVDLGKSIELEIDALQSEISLKSVGVDAIQERAERLFKAHEIDLKKYYNLALKQNNSIFIVGLVCIMIGFVFIGFTIYIIFWSAKILPFHLQILIGILGALSGILTNFIAIVYLKMFSETLGSFTTFHNKLVATNHLHFTNFLVSKIEDINMRNETIKLICERISENSK